MRITVEYWNQVKVATGISGETLDVVDGTDASALLLHVAKRYGNPLHDLMVTADGHLRSSTILSLNGELASCRIRRPLHEGDVVALMLPIAGG